MSYERLPQCIQCGELLADTRNPPLMCADCASTFHREYEPEDPREYEAEADPKKYDQGGEG